MLTKETILKSFTDQLPYFHEKYGVVGFGLFGSFARGTANDESDIDIVVELERPLGFKFIHLGEELEQLFKRKIDLLTPSGLKTIRHAEIKDSIENELIYVKA